MNKSLIKILIIGYFLFLLILPFELFVFLYRFNYFPALDLMVIYYFCSKLKVNNVVLFVLGVLIDPMHNMPIGTNSLSLICGNVLINKLKEFIEVQDYILNCTIFCFYSLLIIVLRFLIITIVSSYYIEGNSIYFYYVITILIYPSVQVIVLQPLKWLK